MSASDPAGKIRWFVGIPVGTNPLILLDVAFLLVVLWLGTSLFIMAGQLFLGGGLTLALMRAACVLGGYLALIGLAAFFFIALFVFGNRYAALYTLEERGISCESMRGKIITRETSLLQWKPFAVEPLFNTNYTTTKELLWEDIFSIQQIKRLNTLVLKGKRSSLMKLYCPDEQTYFEAKQFIEEHLRDKH